MILEPTKIHDAYLIKPKVFGDDRGFFLETWNEKSYREAGIDVHFVQDNHSRSARHVLRGMHFQKGAAAQGKLVWVTSGQVYDAFVDMRRDSPTFGQWDGHLLTADRFERLWVPPGCAHGFLVISDTADFHYKCTNYYHPSEEGVLQWDDPAIGIHWPLTPGMSPILSQRDMNGKLFADSDFYEGNVSFQSPQEI